MNIRSEDSPPVPVGPISRFAHRLLTRIQLAVARSDLKLVLLMLEEAQEEDDREECNHLYRRICWMEARTKTLEARLANLKQRTL